MSGGDLLGGLAPGQCRCTCGCRTTTRPGYTLCEACGMALCGGDAAKRVAHARALAAERAAEWREKAEAVIERLARSGIAFTSEDVTTDAGLPRGHVAANRNNAVGALMAAMAKRGVIRKTGRYVASLRRRSHGAALAEWRGR